MDTAQRYGCQGVVREAMRKSGVESEGVFLTDKVWPGNYSRARESVMEEMSLLGVEYLDLLLLHWPGGEGVEGAWRDLELLLEEGAVRAIGVSNFLQRHLERLLKTASVVPHVNQIEWHPYQQNDELLAHCQELGVVVEGYSPLGKGLCLRDPTIVSISKELGVTPAQVCVRWSLERGVVTIPKSTKVERVEENMAVWGFSLTQPQMEAVNGLHRGERVTWDPDTVP